MELTDMQWRKSSYSSGNGEDCVEVAGASGAVAVRDSKDPARGLLRVPANEWRYFLGGVEVGEFDC